MEKLIFKLQLLPPTPLISVGTISFRQRF